MRTKHLRQQYDDLAPDGSEIRLAFASSGGSLVHCTLPPGAVTLTHQHRTVEEVWCFLSGKGRVWRKEGDLEQCVDVGPGVCLDIPTGTEFQFRNDDPQPLTFVIMTTPPWPGPDEAVRVRDHWEPRL